MAMSSFNAYAEEIANLESVVKPIEDLNVETMESVNSVSEDLNARGYSLKGSSLEIRSFEDLKPNLEYKSVPIRDGSSDLIERLVLKGGNYEIVSNFEIDLDDPFFSGKEEAIRYGLISAIENISINGNGHTVSFKQNKAVALFSLVNCPEYIIENLKVSYPGDVSGFGFAQMLKSKDNDTGLAKATGLVKNVEINVGGNINPLEVNGQEVWSNHFIGQYKGVMSTGFSWYIQNTDIENIDININGNIGDTSRPTVETDMVAAYGFTHHFGNVAYTKDYNASTWERLHNQGDPSVLKDAGHIIGLNINVGGNIQAYGNNTGYSAGVGQDMASAWMENINVKITGNIITDLVGNSTNIPYSYTTPYAFGVSDELMNLTDSSLEVNNIIFNGKNLSESSDLVLVGATANNNSTGNYINIKNNNIKVRGKIEGKSNQNILSSIGFNNDWNSSENSGVNWIHVNENNNYDVGQIDLKSDKIIQFNALGKKWRTGQNPLGTQKLPEASLKDNKVIVGDINIVSSGTVSTALLMFNSSNAKNNTLDYGNITIKGNSTSFYGMGNLQNKQPTTNFYENIAENNHVTMKDLNIETKEAPYISMMVGFQDTEQKLKNSTVNVGKVSIKLDNNSYPSYIGGIASFSKDIIDSCRVFAGSVKIENTGNKNIYFGLGASRANGTTIKNSGVFVDSDIDIQSPTLYGGGFIGYSKGSTIQGNDFQLDGKNNIQLSKGTYGGFGGWLSNSTIKNNSSLILNDFAPFAGHANGGIITGAAHYVKEKAPQYFSALLSSGGDNPKIINSTLLVEKEFEDTILYRKDSISEDSGDNYLVVVDGGSDFNRTAYKVAETVSTSEEMGEEVPVFKKIGEPIGKINIKERTFQDRYWNVDVAPYEVGNEENNFDYMIKNQAGQINVFGIDSNKIVSADGTKAILHDYYHRHAGLMSDTSIVYDLLGIRGDSTDEDDNPIVPINPQIPLVPLEPEVYERSEDSSIKITSLNKNDHYQYLIGYEDQTFRAENNMTRQEVTVMFSRLLENRPEKGRIYSRDYKDVPDSLWSVTAISYMSKLGIIKGYPDGNFKPNGSITRAEFAAIASRFDNLTVGDKTFIDVSADHWAYDSIKKAAKAGWISGYPDGTFKPDQPITRAEVVTITNRMLNRYADEDYVESHREKIINYIDLDNTHWAYYPVVEATNGHEFKRKSNGKDELWLEITDKSFVYDK